MVIAPRSGWSARCAAAALVAGVALTACSGGGDEPPEAAGELPSTSAAVDSPTTTGAEATSEGISPQPPTVTTSEGGGGVVGTEPPSSQEAVLDTLPGDDSGACIDADGQRDVRSGDMGAGTFTEAAEDYADDINDDISLHWIPAHAESLLGLTVRGTQLTGGDATFVAEQTTVSELVDESGQWRYYYNTSFMIPAPGLWRLEATSGDDTGCFTVTFTS
jgi:hypothetical protein